MSNHSENRSPIGAIVGVILAILAVVGGGWALLHDNGSSEGRGGDTNLDSLVLDGDLTVGDDITITGDTQTIGSSGTVSFWTAGGVDFAAVTESFTSTSSVPLVIDNPFSATTSIDKIMCVVTGNGLGAQVFDISTTTAAGGYGSSTPALVYGVSIGANAQETFLWQPAGSSTTPWLTLAVPSNSNGKSPYILKPNEDVTVRIATSSPGTFSSYLSGSCALQVSKP